VFLDAFGSQRVPEKPFLGPRGR